MKRLRIVFSIICFLSCINSAHAGEKLTVMAIKDLYLANLGKRVLTEAYQKLDVSIEFIDYPAERALSHSNSGKADGELGRIAGLNKKYPNMLLVPVPVFWLEGMVFTKEAAFEVDGWKSLKPYRIGIMRGIKFAEKGTDGMNRQVVNTIIQMFKLLEVERVDVVVETRINGLKCLQDHCISGIKPLEPPLVSKKLYHYLHKKNEILVPRISAVLKEMESQGRIHEMRKQFIAEIKLSNAVN